MTPKWSKYIPHSPTPKQEAFLLLDDVLEVLYGGQAGGGKSDSILMAALQYVDIPGYSALILRKTYADLALPEAIMDRFVEWAANTDVHWDGGAKQAVFPSGAKLVFGYLASSSDHLRYQSASFHFIGIDESTQIPWNQQRYLFSRCRRLEKVKGDIPLRYRLASNPGGPAHEETRTHFIDSPNTASKVFLPASLEDNPYLDRESYERSLSKLDPVTHRQLRYGDWSVVQQGNMFRREWFKLVSLGDAKARKATLRWWDLAATDDAGDWTVGIRMSWLQDNTYLIEDVQRVQYSPHMTERLIRATAAIDGISCEIWMEQEPGASGKIVIDHYKRNVLAGYAFHGEPSTGPKNERAKPLSAACEGGLVLLVRGIWNDCFLNELVAFPTEFVHDDQVDCASSAHAKLVSKRKRAGAW